MGPDYSADNVLIGAGDLYVDGINVGYTRDGVTFAFERTVYDVMADQANAPVKSVKTQEVLNVSTTLLEATLENLRLVWDIPGTVQVGVGEKTLFFGGGGDQMTEHEVIFVGNAPGGYTRTITLWRCVSVESGEHSYQKEEETRVPATFRALEDPTKEPGQTLGSIVDETD